MAIVLIDWLFYYQKCLLFYCQRCPFSGLELHERYNWWVVAQNTCTHHNLLPIHHLCVLTRIMITSPRKQTTTPRKQTSKSCKKNDYKSAETNYKSSKTNKQVLENEWLQVLGLKRQYIRTLSISNDYSTMGDFLVWFRVAWEIWWERYSPKHTLVFDA